MRSILRATLLATAVLHLATPANALDKVEVKRLDAARVQLSWEDSDQVDVYRASAPDVPYRRAVRVGGNKGGGSIELAVPSDQRAYFLLRDHGDKHVIAVSERELPLEQGSNFRDLGGYVGAGGKTVKWGRIFRSGAMPLLTERDYRLLSGLDIRSIVDLRSLEEREVAPTTLDDRTGALFLSNDYSITPMMRQYMSGKVKGPMYAGLEQLIRPQVKAVFNRLLADDGAVLYHCSAGQDRTGVTSALILTTLGVDRATILRDYHLSTALRRPQNEMPPIDPADHPNNVIVQYYAAAAKRPGGMKAEPLYTPDGESLLAQFFAHVEATHGSVETYLEKEFGIGPVQTARLRSLYLAR